MPCFSPNLAFYDLKSKSVRFTRVKAFRTPEGIDPYVTQQWRDLVKDPNLKALSLPCGKCVWCRLQNAKEKAIRAQHEASLYDDNCFLTLTYAKVPDHGSYEMRDIQLFMKRLRRLFPERKIKSFGCAEYGEGFSRPHFHLCLFNFDFPDKKFWRYSQNDFSSQKWPVFRSQILEDLWPHGFTEIGSLTFESAAYVARYVSKKITGDLKDSHYGDRLPERSVAVSRRPGIGLDWLEKFSKAVLNHDSVIINGREHKPPRYYLKKLEQSFPEEFAVLKQKRIDAIKKVDFELTKDRLKVKEKLHTLKFKRLKRGFEGL